ncbi:MAG: hypothetical protein LDL15_04485 [Yonghaparkia sp.]|nr:hypothetical protein [Microcella sp.]
MNGTADAGLIVALTLAVLGVMVVVLGIIAVLVLGPAVRRALADRRDEHEAGAAAAVEGSGQGTDSAEGAEHSDGGRG